MKKFSKHSRDKRRSEIALFENQLYELCRIPTKSNLIDRYLGLFQTNKGREKRQHLIYKELLVLWQKLNFPILSKDRILIKLKTLIKQYENFRKHKSKSNVSFEALFDITKSDGMWLSNEDKKFYQQQIKSEGQIGYTTKKVANINTIHPSKPPRIINQAVSPKRQIPQVV